MVWFVLLELKINGHIDAVVTDLNGTDIFLEYGWLVKHNPEVNWNIGTIQSKGPTRVHSTIYILV